MAMPRISKLRAGILMSIEVTLGFFALPLALSAFSVHYAWNPGPSWWNLPGIIFVSVGSVLLLSGLRAQFGSLTNPQRLSLSLPEHLIQTGPYRFTRNPLYLAAGLMWLGWTVFFGSLLILVGLAILVGGTSSVVIPWEERKSEMQFGDAYVRYKRAVPRWLGRRHPLE